MKLKTTGKTTLQTFSRKLDLQTVRLHTVKQSLDRKNPESYMDSQTRRYWEKLSWKQKETILERAREASELQQKKTVDFKRRTEETQILPGRSRKVVCYGNKSEETSPFTRYLDELFGEGHHLQGTEKKLQKMERIEEMKQRLQAKKGLQNVTAPVERLKETKALEDSFTGNEHRLPKENAHIQDKEKRFSSQETTQERARCNRTIKRETAKESQMAILFQNSEKPSADMKKAAAQLGENTSIAIKTAKKAAGLAKNAARETMGKEEEKREFAVSTLTVSEGAVSLPMGAPRLQQAIAAVIMMVSALLQSAFAMLLPFCMVLAVFASVVAGVLSLLFGGAASGYAKANVSAACEQYRPVVEEYAVQYGMEEYVELILAVMMQESGGTLPDVMQAAEGAYNTRYPKVPNGITDPDYSIQCGIQELKHALELAGCTGPTDMEHIKLALQGYNFGPGYITWAKENYGGYTEENAAAFSDMMADKMGWSGYGDKQYVPHVLRYYEVVYGYGDAEAIINEGMKYMGMPYVFGGSSPETSFDCSGFVYYVFNQCGYQVPRYTAQGFYDASIKVSEQDAQPGDLVFFERTYACPERITHIGIYIGNGQMMHFGNPGKISPVSVFGDKLVGYGRIQPPV